MTKRIVAGVLWFAAVAYAWNILALVAGIADVPGFALGLLAAWFVAADPLHRIWTGSSRAG